MQIRLAKHCDLTRIHELLGQVLNVHHQARPDLFKSGARKYTDEELIDILQDPKRPIFVYVNDEGVVMGYAFCILQQHLNDNILTDIKTLYIDDLYVDENARHQRIGRQLYDYVVEYARSIGCYNVTLNVWADNINALQFYRALNLKEQKIGMEIIL
ncbi:GNAT family N-acetyltransferase [Allobaculum stercoricanis]|uniref:GNAT family N-acetyltransferase n=1 Tax=Allobaculum stercoricanis TaxID=174709 RepID=UPI00248E91D2|nr:GNAT family N-acetyltransferase [Allobaculum stercoricanis]